MSIFSLGRSPFVKNKLNLSYQVLGTTDNK